MGSHHVFTETENCCQFCFEITQLVMTPQVHFVAKSMSGEIMFEIGGVALTLCAWSSLNGCGNGRGKNGPLTFLTPFLMSNFTFKNIFLNLKDCRSNQLLRKKWFLITLECRPCWQVIATQHTHIKIFFFFGSVWFTRFDANMFLFSCHWFRWCSLCSAFCPPTHTPPQTGWIWGVKRLSTP